MNNNFLKSQVALSEIFLDGNFLVHCTEVEALENIIKDGAVKNVASLGKDNGQSQERKWKMHGGEYGISFSYNKISVLPGTPGRIVFLLTSPEFLLEETLKLFVPFRASKNELQLSKIDVDITAVHQIDALLDFFGLRNLMKPVGVIAEMEELEREKEKSRIFKQVKKYQAKINLKNIISFTNSTFRINPELIDEKILAGVYYLEFLCHYSPWKLKNKTHVYEYAVGELLTLEKNSIPFTQKVVKEIYLLEKKIAANIELSIPLNKFLIFVPERELSKWKEVIVNSNHQGLMLFSYPETASINKPGWEGRQNDSARLSRFIRNFIKSNSQCRRYISYKKILQLDKSIALIPPKQALEFLPYQYVKNAGIIIKEGDQVVIRKNDR
ncbi:MAG: hypothetical protein WCJ58_07705 [bacterium]